MVYDPNACCTLFTDDGGILAHAQCILVGIHMYILRQMNSLRNEGMRI